MKNSQAAKLITKSHRKAKRLLQAHLAEMFTLYSTFGEMENQLGREGFKKWMEISCPDITWAEVELTLAHVEQSPLNALFAERISRN